MISFPLVWKVVPVELVDGSIDLFSEAKLQLISRHLRDVSTVNLDDLKHILKAIDGFAHTRACSLQTCIVTWDEVLLMSVLV